MAYRVVHDYYRKELFDFFSPYVSPFWAVNFELEVTAALAALRQRQYPTYLNLCYLVTRAAQGIDDLRYRLKDGQIVLHDTLHFGATLPAPGGRFRFHYLDFDPDIEAFNRVAAERTARPAPEGLGLKVDRERAWLFFSALPKIAFTGLTHAWRDPDDDEPRVSVGRFVERDGGTRLPVGVQVNHRLVDGDAVGELAERAAAELAGLR
ncbi:MAG: CatA-like O-acetyltransferase [Thermoanaerobaculia bacterium]|nr:CatA-like O-acetyltransferase [Thermoanaerobaculia bacterium]